jgi:nucleotide-binding universal stress UspA family protein
MSRTFQVEGKLVRVRGEAGHAIIEEAVKENAGLLVTGCRGMGTIRRTFLGSISDYVIHHSPVPVLVCRHEDNLIKH